MREGSPKTKYNSVDEYIEAQPSRQQEVLRQVRRTLRSALPKAVEGISYQIPTLKMDGRPVVYFAAWKKHFSLYPATGHVVSELHEELAPYEVTKGTIRFPLNERVPSGLIRRIAKVRAKDVGELKALPSRHRSKL